MKKHLQALLSSLLILVLLAGSLVSCSVTQADKLNRMEEPNRAFALLDLINENGENADSYMFELEMSMNGVFSEIDMECTATGEFIYSGLKGETPTFHSEFTTRIKAMEGLIDTTAETKEGFREGKMYYSYHDENADQKLWSPISWADYQTYQDSKSEGSESDIVFDIQPDDCGTITCVQEEDKTWTASMTDFTEDGLKSFESMTKGMAELFGDDYAIKDATFTYKANEEFFLTSINLNFTFEALDKDNKEDLPELSIEVTVSGYGTTEPKGISLDSYTEVADLRVLDIPEEELESFMNGEEGLFALSIDQRIKLGTESNNYEETDRVSFSNKDGKYTYNITADQDDYTVLITYADGTTTTVVKQGSKKISEDSDRSTDEEAKEFVDNLIMQTGFDTNLITDIELKDSEKGIYEFHMNPADNAMLKEMMESVGSDKLGKSEAIYTITIKDGKLLKIEFNLDAKMETDYGTLNADVIIICDFTIE